MVGKRTWGEFLGRAGAPPLFDGGLVTAPSSAVWDTAERRWIAANTGIQQIEVEHDPEHWGLHFRPLIFDPSSSTG